MKKFLKKPLSKSVGIMLATALATGGLTALNTANATGATATVSANNLGDMALVPYYTVRGDYVTGVHITNTSANTQVVKFRLRRATDSADALDINIILSPYDMWTGYLKGDGTDVMLVPTDKSCTAPQLPSGKSFFTAPDVNKAGADEGYIEIIGMGQPQIETGSSTLAVGALHNTVGIPANCGNVANNFLAANVTSNATTQTSTTSGSTTYDSTENVLKVQYFIRDGASGMEFGDNAVHFAGFSDEAMMTNQQTGLSSGDFSGFDFPDLDGGGANGAARGLYSDEVRRLLGTGTILNDWSYSTSTNAATDWVVTVPGQYLMVNPNTADTSGTSSSNRHTDLPLIATISVRDREEAQPAGGSLVVSPSPQADSTVFPNEVNVIEWGGKSVFGSAAPVKITDPGVTSTKGWASLSLAVQTGSRKIFNLATGDTTGATPTTTNVPVLGFTAWQRTFTGSENRNYGRIIHHSRTP
jgi:hypothetical protein